jgi:hypothetical protein
MPAESGRFCDIRRFHTNTGQSVSRLFDIAHCRFACTPWLRHCLQTKRRLQAHSRPRYHGTTPNFAIEGSRPNLIPTVTPAKHRGRSPESSRPASIDYVYRSSCKCRLIRSKKCDECCDLVRSTDSSERLSHRIALTGYSIV